MAIRCQGTLLVSHVLTELSPRQTDELANLANRATAIVWVEPGTFDASRALIAVRERLRGTLHLVAPCTHQAACGMLAPGRERYWCHHFATSPPEAFTDGRWARWAREMGIDLRSLPLAYLVLDRRPPAPLPPGAVRLIGRPRVQKAYALLCGCDKTGVHERRLAKRAFPQEFRDARRDCLDSLQTWECDGDAVTRLCPLADGPPDSTAPAEM
jgi:ribosomal protein RSM22 (predicted rRNA methylase)